MSSILGQGNLSGLADNIRNQLQTKRTEMSSRFPQLNLMGQGLGGGVMGQGGSRPLDDIRKRLQMGNILGQGMKGQGLGILDKIRSGKGLLRQNSSFRTFGGGTVNTPGPKPGQARKTANYRAFQA